MNNQKDQQQHQKYLQKEQHHLPELNVISDDKYVGIKKIYSSYNEIINIIKIYKNQAVNNYKSDPTDFIGIKNKIKNLSMYIQQQSSLQTTEFNMPTILATTNTKNDFLATSLTSSSLSYYYTLLELFSTRTLILKPSKNNYNFNHHRKVFRRKSLFEYLHFLSSLYNFHPFDYQIHSEKWESVEVPCEVQFAKNGMNLMKLKTFITSLLCLSYYLIIMIIMIFIICFKNSFNVKLNSSCLVAPQTLTTTQFTKSAKSSPSTGKYEFFKIILQFS